MEACYQDLDAFSRGGGAFMKLNWELILSYGLTMDIFGKGNTTWRFFGYYYRLYTFDHKRQHTWNYMVTTPGKTVQCPWEVAVIDIYMDSVHK